MRGVLRFEGNSTISPGRVVRLRIVDTSRVGADAIVLDEVTLPIPHAFDPGTQDLPFEIEIPEQRQGLTIQAHVRAHDSEDIRKGDMITTAAIPLPVRDDETVLVPLKTV
ncbi:MAG: hypothetical protein AAF999_10095 [Pseudomonadota bacterium]